MTKREIAREAAWTALKARCCSDPKKAKRIVMVGESDSNAATDAALSALRTDVEGVARVLAKARYLHDYGEELSDEESAVMGARCHQEAQAAINYWLGEEAR
jgi:hypothetical protein